MKLEKSVVHLPVNYTGALPDQIDDLPRGKEDFLHRRKDICLPKEVINRLMGHLEEKDYLALVPFKVEANRQ